MNLTLNSTNGPATQPRAAAPAVIDTAAAPARDANGSAPQAPAQPALAFAQWLGLDPAAPATPGIPPASEERDGAAAAPDGAAATAVPAEEQPANADAPLLGAMAMNMPPMPLMPSAQATLAAVAAALPGAPIARQAAPVLDTDTASLPNVPAAHRGGAALGLADGARGPVSGTPPNAGAAPVAAPAEALASRGDAPQEQAVPGAERGAANTAGVAAPAPGSAQRTADSVTLSGPPTAWRQTLQEALGDRLQLQLGKNAEQAVIRLDPPMLGRVEIAIRHSAGSLEVHISATHGEVLRQLQAVGENLRNDLAQRQFTDVAVNIAAAPRAAAAGNMNTFAGEGGGRGRQHEGQQEQDPGSALAEANTGAYPFSLNGRAST